MNKRKVYYEKDYCWTTTNKGTKVFVDLIDSDLLENHSWSEKGSRKRFYPSTRYRGKQNKLHKLIQERCLNSGLVDHIDCDTFNNRRSNLRIATCQQNNGNVGLTVRNTTGLKGVYCKRGKYVAQIKNQGKKETFDLIYSPQLKEGDKLVMYVNGIVRQRRILSVTHQIKLDGSANCRSSITSVEVARDPGYFDSVFDIDLQPQPRVAYNVRIFKPNYVGRRLGGLRPISTGNRLLLGSA